MKKVYNFKLRGTGGEASGIGIGGIGIGNPAGEGIGVDEGGGESADISPEGYMFYNIRLDRILYYLTCSNGDSLGSVNDVDLRAYNV